MENIEKYLKNFKGKKTVMAIYPHPDDETMAAGGLLMVAKKLGFQSVVACLTHGEVGENHAPQKGRTLSEIRVDELNGAAQILGVDQLELMDFGDGKLRGAEKKWRSWILEVIKKYDPGIIVTYDHSGSYGHPDHIALSLVIMDEVKKIKQPPVLFWNTLSKGYYEKLDWTKDVREFMTVPTHYLNLGILFFRKHKAAMAHKTQKLGKDLPVPMWLVLAIYNKEWYHKVDLKRAYPYKYLTRTF